MKWCSVILLPGLLTSGMAEISFNREIRPILSENCFYCHGQDGNKRKAGLRLDQREGAMKPKDDKEIAIVPGKPEESSVIRRLLSTDPDEVMPPANSHRTVMVALTILAALFMRYTDFGRAIYAVGGNMEAARAAGINPERSVIGVFALHGLFTGVAGILFATQLQVIQSTVPPNLELTVITASVIGGVSILGGTGTVIGSTLAAILFACIGSALIFLNVSAYWLRAVLGLLILATVLADMARRRRAQ